MNRREFFKGAAALAAVAPLVSKEALAHAAKPKPGNNPIWLMTSAFAGIPTFDGVVDEAVKLGAQGLELCVFRKDTDGLNQAKNFLETIGWRKLDLPLVVDVEDWSNAKNVEDERTQKNLDAMLDNLRSRGHKVMVYTNGDGYKKYIKDGQININLWLCAFKQPDKLKHIPHQLQQYSHWGRVKGIWGDVDLNVFNGSQEQWDKWLQDLTPQQFDIPVDSTLINDNEEYIIHDEL